MPFLPASSASIAAFVAVLAAVLGGFIALAVRAAGNDPARRRSAGVRAGVWLVSIVGGFSALTLSGRLASLPLAGMPFFFGPVVLLALYLGLSRFGGEVARTVPLAWLVGFQAFRLPLELVLHAWAEQGTIPATMTWTGQNWDIVSGVVALVAAPFASRHRGVAWAANLIGAVLLLNVMRVAILSAPVPFGWGVQPPLVLFLHYPYALIGPVCVGGAMVGHVWLTRALLNAAAPAPSPSRNT